MCDTVGHPIEQGETVNRIETSIRPKAAALPLIALTLAGLLAHTAAASTHSLGAQGSCSATVSATRVNLDTGSQSSVGAKASCLENWASAPGQAGQSGTAQVETALGSASSHYAATARYGSLSVSAHGVAASHFSANLNELTQGYAAGTATTFASFADTLTLGAAHLNAGSAFTLVVGGAATVGGQQHYNAGYNPLAPSGTGATFEILLNGTSVYNAAFGDSNLWDLESAQPVIHAFTVQPSDTIQVLGKVTADAQAYMATPWYPDWGIERGYATLAIHMDVLGSGAPLVSASGHDYSSAAAVAAIPEPSTWALMACGLLTLAATGLRRRKGVSANAATAVAGQP